MLKYILQAVFMATTLVSSVQAQPAKFPSNSRLSGDIEIEETKAKAQSKQSLGLGAAAKWIDSMKQVVDGGGNGSPPALDDNTATYLSTLYLYCIYKLGPCPYILDAVLEADVIGNRGKSTTDCPTMSRFWKTWLSNDLEQRSKYLLSIGNGTAVANFNAVERPKYVKCKDTISKITSGESNSRYGNSGSITAAVTRTQRFIKEVQSKNIDVFSAVGLGTGAEVSSSKK